MDITNDREYQFKVLYMEEFVLLSTKPISKINVQGVPHHIRPRTGLNYDFRD